jgi:hypothetical protein
MTVVTCGGVFGLVELDERVEDVTDDLEAR